eukprot:TRINITY_DN64205_c0_g1_i1.p1 TRINITY_DN64205_c0_g1~~TRINITY_DN64205_c0_g1_i1.p1  ORF type:complete len:842 (+),score=127.67 TRINITY_DN64205_c0_g1_i1:59-2584(+)
MKRPAAVITKPAKVIKRPAASASLKRPATQHAHSSSVKSRTAIASTSGYPTVALRNNVGEVVARVPDGKQVEIVGEFGDKFRIRYQGKEGNAESILFEVIKQDEAPAAEPKARVYLAQQRCKSREHPRADLLGIFTSAEAAIACAARAEAPFSFASGESVRVELYEKALSCGYIMPSQEVHGTIRERKLGSISEPVRYVVDVEHNARFGPPGAPLKQQLSKDDHELDMERILKSKDGPLTLRPGIMGTTTIVDVPLKYIEKSLRASRRKEAGDSDSKLDDGGYDDADDASDDRSEESGKCKSSDSELSSPFGRPGEDLEFIVEENCLDEEVFDSTVWVALRASNRCIKGDIRVCSSLPAANKFSQQRFAKSLAFFVGNLKDRKTTSGLKEVPADVLLGRPGECIQVPAKHCYASTIRDSSFLGGVCDYGEDDFSDIENDEEVDFTEQAYKEHHWVKPVHVGVDQPLPAPISREPRPKVCPKVAPMSKGDVHVALMTSGETECPWQHILGLYSDVTLARARLVEMEHKDSFEVGTKVRIRAYTGVSIFLKGAVSARHQDIHSEHCVSYDVELTYDEHAKQLGPRGATLPATLPNKYDKRRPDTLRPGIEGTTSSIKVPRQLLDSEDSLFDRVTTFKVDNPTITADIDIAPANNRLAKLIGTNRGGLALAMPLQDRIYDFVNCHVWLSCYEPSTTGWGDECSYQLFRSAAAANRNARDAFKDRIRQLRCISTPDAKFLQPEDEPGRFKRLPAFSLFTNNYPAVRNFKKVIDKERQCFAWTFKKGLFVAAVSNYHGDHLDGCGNPYMAEWWWVEKRSINSLHLNNPKQPAKRRSPAHAGGCTIC